MPKREDSPMDADRRPDARPAQRHSTGLVPAVPRRAALAGATAAAAAMALGAGPLTRAAAPTRGSGVITLTFAAKNTGGPTPLLVELMQRSLAGFYASNRGVRVNITPAGVDTGAVLVQIFAGVAPDIIYDNYIAPYTQQNLLVPLTPYIKRDQVNPDIWNPAQVSIFTGVSGQMAVPVYTGTMAQMLNYTALDQAGLKYPTPDWTYTEFTALARALVLKQTSQRPQRYGTNLRWNISGPGENAYYLKAFGGALVSPGAAPSQLSQGANLRALQWMYEDMIWPGVGRPGGAGASDITSGALATEQVGTWWLVSVAQAMISSGLKLDFLPPPIYPGGRGCHCTADFYAIPQVSRHPDQAWELLRYVSAEPEWQRATFRYALLSPALNSLWDEWEQTVRATVPVFRTKQLQWFAQAAQQGYAYPAEYYPYADGQVTELATPEWTLLGNRQVDVVAGATQLDRMINAFERTAGPAIAGAEGQARITVARYLAEAAKSAGAVTFPTPPEQTAGDGVAPTPTKGITVSSAGTVTMRAQGALGLTRANGDNCSFAGSTYTSSRGTFTARLVAVSLPDGGGLPNACKIGLMARANLSSQAAAVAIWFGGNRGVRVFGRAVSATEMADSGAAGNPSVQVAGSPPAGGNWLLKPGWFRFVLLDNVWTPYYSFDGKSWTQAGPGQAVWFVGAWVGVFASSHQRGTTVEAVFDKLTGFQPATRVQIGNP